MPKSGAKKIKEWTIVLDGKEYVDGSPEEGADLATNLISYKGKLLGFTSQKLFLEWAATEGMRQEIEKTIQKIENAKKEMEGLSESQKEKKGLELAAKVERDTASFNAKLKEKGVKPSDVKRIHELAQKGEIGTLVLYDDINFKGATLVLQPGVYPNFKWIHFNDRAESAIDLNPYWCVLCQHIWWFGKWYWIRPIPYGADPNFGWFRNRASSAFA